MYLLTFFTALLLAGAPAPQTLNLTVTTTVDRAGEIRLAVYDSKDGFQQRAEVLSVVRQTSGNQLTFSVELPAAGDYVLAAFHDLNGNGELDTNMFGVPTEPYGFGKVPPTKWREPEFGEIAVSVTEGGGKAEIALKKWKEY